MDGMVKIQLMKIEKALKDDDAAIRRFTEDYSADESFDPYLTAPKPLGKNQLWRYYTTKKAAHFQSATSKIRDLLSSKAI